MRVVEEDPLDARAGDDRDDVALADAEVEQAVRELVDPARSLGPGHRLPAARALDQVGRVRPSGGRGLAPERGDRARPGRRRLGIARLRDSRGLRRHS